MSWGGIKRDLTDKLFSDYIRLKARYVCERCIRDFSGRTEIFDCSHFYSRGNKSVRFYEDNVAPVCRGCHQHFEKNPHDHRDFFFNRLGEERYNALVWKAKLPMKEKTDHKMLRLWLKAEIKKLERC